MASKPNFLVVGAAKAGTSWVHQCLQEHPDVYVPARKEIRFFSVNYDRGEEWYGKFFDGHSEETAVGEVSPSYMVHEKAPKRIYKYNSKINLIFVLRNPIKRAYSHYCMTVRSGESTKKIEKELTKGNRTVEDGMYLSAIKRYLNFFEREKIKIHIFDDLKDSPRRFIEGIYSNIGVNKKFRPKIINKKYHSRKKIPAYKWVHNFGTSILKEAKKIGLSGLVQKLRKSRITKIYNRVNKGEDFPKMSDNKKRYLRRVYKNQIRGLSKYVDRNLEKKWLEERNE